jgi:hypothetical protein
VARPAARVSMHKQVHPSPAHRSAMLAIAMRGGRRVITVSSGRFKTIAGWLRTSLVVIGLSRS